VEDTFLIICIIGFVKLSLSQMPLTSQRSSRELSVTKLSLRFSQLVLFSFTLPALRFGTLRQRNMQRKGWEIQPY